MAVSSNYFTKLGAGNRLRFERRGCEAIGGRKFSTAYDIAVKNVQWAVERMREGERKMK